VSRAYFFAVDGYLGTSETLPFVLMSPLHSCTSAALFVFSQAHRRTREMHELKAMLRFYRWIFGGHCRWDLFLPFDFIGARPVWNVLHPCIDRHLHTILATLLV
jgi:hypothetical protein